MSDAPRHAKQLQEYIEQGLVADKDLEFATSLVNAAHSRRGITDKQRHWVGVLCDRCTEEKEPEPKVDIDLAGVYTFFLNARKHLKFPKIVCLDDNDVLIKFYLSGPRSKHPDTLNITAPDFDRWYGRIFADGTYHHPHNLDADRKQEILAILKKLADDPHSFAAAYGKLTGHCCFCNRYLSDDRSVTVGYGPVCAARFGLKEQWKRAAG